MEQKHYDLTGIALEAIELFDWFRGAMSGGIESPRELISMLEREDGAVEISWKNPDVAGVGIVDPPYHYEDTSVHTSLFRITEDGLLVVNGKVDVFMVSGEPELLKKADDFYRRWGLKNPEKLKSLTPELMPWELTEEEQALQPSPDWSKSPHGKPVGRRMEPYHDVTVYEDGHEEWDYIGD